MFWILARPSNAKLMSPIGHPRSPSCAWKVEGGDDGGSWYPAGVRFFGIGCRKLGRSARELGPKQDRRPTLRISLGDLPQIAAKRFQDQMVFRARKLSARALHL